MREVVLNSHTIVFTEEVLRIFEKFTQTKSKDLEAGGILLGQAKEKEKRIFVTKASIPSEFDKATRTSFYRNPKIAQVIINYEFLNSGKRNVYLGEWHTHPEKSPKPSQLDDKMIYSQYNENRLNYPFLIQCIQGTSKIFVRLITTDKDVHTWI